MSIAELCNHYLRQFYARRSEGRPICLIEETAPDSDFSDYACACRQLQSDGFIKWIPVMGLPIGLGEITAEGIEAIEKQVGVNTKS
jgi:hypothetical protein